MATDTDPMDAAAFRIPAALQYQFSDTRAVPLSEAKRIRDDAVVAVAIAVAQAPTEAEIYREAREAREAEEANHG